MSEIVIGTVYKAGTRELRSGDFMITFQVDETRVKDLLPLHLLKQDQPLTLILKDQESGLPKEKSPEQVSREKLYARIEIMAGDAGYDETKKRQLFNELTGQESKKDMSLEDLSEVEKFLYAETNPLPEP